MRSNLFVVLFSLFIFNISCEQANKDSNSKDEPKIKFERYITITHHPAIILSQAPDGLELGKIPDATEVKVLDTTQIEMGQIAGIWYKAGTWYKIEYEGITGWVSEFSTTGDITEKELLDEIE